jgi:class I fructose-bisphosphate aldolase
VLRSLHTLFNHGRLAGTGYMSVLPVDQGIEHSAGASFAPNPEYFDGEKLAELAVEGGCNAFASTYGVMGSIARKYAHKVPFICKMNHNQLLTYPAEYDQILFGTVREAWELGAVAVGATIYFGSEQSSRQIVEISRLFHEAHSLGMATVLWCYLRNPAFKKDHPIDLCRYQVVNNYMGRSGLLNSGGESKGASDLQEAVKTAVINKRAGGMGLITGRKAFQRPMKEGVNLFHAIQDVYLNDEITIA